MWYKYLGPEGEEYFSETLGSCALFADLGILTAAYPHILDIFS